MTAETVPDPSHSVYPDAKVEVIGVDSEPVAEPRWVVVNYDILGLIVQKVSGQSFEEYVEEHIL